MSAPEKRDDQSPVICACFGVTERRIREHLANVANDYETLVAETSVGTRCTACLLDLDLVVDDAVSLRNSVTRRLGHGPQVGSGLLAAVDQSNSGFFICDDKVSTIVRVANYGMLFNSEIVGVPYDYSIQLVAENGTLIAKRSGAIDRDAVLHFVLSELTGGVGRGWFLLSLYPRAVGIVGSVRPQVALCGNGWSATYHVQLHSMATCDRTRNAVAVFKGAAEFGGAVSIINAREEVCQIEARLSDGDGGIRQSTERVLPSRGAQIFELDDLFPEVPARRTYRLEIVSDQPTRKHILVRHADGSLSVDHFPN